MMANNVGQMTDKQWDTIIALHNTAPFKLVRAAASYFRVKDGESRNIINISSTSGVNGNAYEFRKTLLRYLTNRISVVRPITACKLCSLSHFILTHVAS